MMPLKLLSRHQHPVAWGVALVWTMLSSLCVIDVIEDAEHGSEPLDVLVIRALAMPAESALQTPHAPLARITPMIEWLRNTAILAPHLLGISYFAPDARKQQDHPPRASPSLFELRVLRL